MTQEEANMIERYFDAGYFVKFNDTSFADSEVHGIYENDNGSTVFDSEVFSEKELLQVPIWNVIIAQPVFSLETSDNPVIQGEPGDYGIRTVNGEDV